MTAVHSATCPHLSPHDALAEPAIVVVGCLAAHVGELGKHHAHQPVTVRVLPSRLSSMVRDDNGLLLIGHTLPAGPAYQRASLSLNYQIGDQHGTTFSKTGFSQHQEIALATQKA